MIEYKYFRFTSVIVICISALSCILGYFRIQYQFYVWELFIDAKIFALLFLVFFLYKKKSIQFSTIKLLLLNWNWKKNILYFSLPLFFYVIPIIIGIIFKEVLLNRPDNATTLVLATLFDIPAIFVFSITTILIEEIFFRGFIFSTIRQKRSRMASTIMTSLLWVIYSVPEIIGMEEINTQKIFVVLLFFFSVGILCSVLAENYQSVWIGYSLRVGLITLAPIMVTSLLYEAESFFVTDSLLFNAEGIFVSVLLIMGSFILFRTFQEIFGSKQEKFDM